DFNTKGIVPNTDQKRQNFSLNAGLDLTQKLRADASINYIKSGSDNISGGGYDNNNPMQQFTWFQRNVDVAALKDYKNLPLAPEHTSAGGTPANWNTNFNNNPYWVLHNNTQGFDRDRIIGNIRLSYEITDWLTVSGRTGTDFFNDLQVVKRAVGSNDFPNGTYSEIDRTWYETNSDILITTSHDINEDFKMGGSIGSNMMNQVHNKNRLEAPELEIPGVYNLANSKIAVVAETFEEQKKIHSVYGTVDLSYKDYLFMNITGRNDWSSTLPSNNNSYFYPSVSVSADLTSMFNVQSEQLSYAKIRGGWAQVGADTDPFKLENVYAFFDPWNGSLITPTVSNTLL